MRAKETLRRAGHEANELLCHNDAIRRNKKPLARKSSGRAQAHQLSSEVRGICMTYVRKGMVIHSFLLVSYHSCRFTHSTE